jgi:hypothetical protein
MYPVAAVTLLIALCSLHLITTEQEAWIPPRLSSPAQARSRRRRRRAAAAAGSPEHMSPATSPSPDPKKTERKLYNVLSAAPTTTAPTPPAQMSDRVASKARHRAGARSLSPSSLYYLKTDWEMLP